MKDQFEGCYVPSDASRDFGVNDVGRSFGTINSCLTNCLTLQLWHVSVPELVICWPVGHVTHFTHYLEFILDSNFQFFMLQYHNIYKWTEQLKKNFPLGN
jgi:hypothetical protein